jgi:hypothetical protein
MNGLAAKVHISLHSLDREGKKLLTSYNIHGYLGIILFIKQDLFWFKMERQKAKKYMT